MSAVREMNVRRTRRARLRTRDLERLYAKVRACTKCPRLVASRQRATEGYGSMRVPVMIVGLNPSRTGHNESGIPFRTKAGSLTPSGRPLVRALEALGLRLDDFYFTELTKCHAPDNRPTAREISNCTPYLVEEMRLLGPKIVVALGRRVEQEVECVARDHGIAVAEVKHPSYVQRFLTRRPGYYRARLRTMLALVAHPNAVSGRWSARKYLLAPSRRRFSVRRRFS
jgi:uracil-DNA glycosylase family 4